MDRLLFISADGHAVMPEALWPQYLEAGYHEYLPRLSDENRRFTDVMRLMNDYDLTYEGVVSGSHYDVFDTENLFRQGRWAGAWDRDIRIAEMDREGVAAEFVFNGYFRAVDLFFNVSNTPYPPDVIDAGVRAYHRWAFDTFGSDSDRLLLVGAVGQCLDLDETLREATWIADHKFTGMYMPGFTAHPDLPPLHDERWEPLWALCADRGLTLVVHGGYGFEQGFSFAALTDIYEQVRAGGGSDEDADARAAERAVQRRIVRRFAEPPAALATHARGRVRSPSRPQADDDRGARRLGARHAPAPRRCVRGASRRRPGTAEAQ